MLAMRYQSTRNVVFSAKYHFVWCPKYRRRVLAGGVDVRLKEIIGDVCGELGVGIIEVEVMPDHVHLLAEVPPSVPLSRFMQMVKGCSSRLLRQEFGHLRRMRTLWTRPWFVSTVGGAPLSVVKAYVENQKLAA